MSDFNALAESSIAAGNDLTALQRDDNARNRAMRWLRENKGVTGPERPRCVQVRSSAKSGQARWKKLHELDKKICDKSAEESPVRLFLLVAELFSKFESNPMNFEEYKDTMQDETINYYTW